MTKEFEQYINNTRNEFVEGVNKLQWDTEFRTKCENLLIAFDQMKAALRQPPVSGSVCAHKNKKESAFMSTHWYCPDCNVMLNKQTVR